MLDPTIYGFLNERKEIWLKKKINSTTSDEEKAEFEQQASEEFSLAKWLPNAAMRAKQLSLVSHPSKFSHPSAKTTSIIASAQGAPDGFLRTGNVEVDPDVVGNAAALDVYKFLSLTLSDGVTILSHLEKKTLLIKEQLSDPSSSFDDIEQGLLAIKQDPDSSLKTSGSLKQVYFPVEKAGYHLLSILTPSSMMYKLKERINTMRFSDEAKEVREAKKHNNIHEKNLSEIFNLSVIGYGGTKPQNISVQNSQNGGTAYLLPSMPPVLTKRTVQPPRGNFFSNSLWIKAFKDDFQKLHEQLVAETNNIHVRKRRDRLIRSIIFQVADQLWRIRHLEAGWSNSDNYQRLPQYQKIWLDQLYAENREKDLAWFDSVQVDLARWFLNTYSTVMDSKALVIGDEQIGYIRKIITECEEALR
jgi:CRISPR-associated protein Csy1